MKATSITATALSVFLGIAVPVALGQGQRDDRQDRSAPQHQQAAPQQGTPSEQRSQQQPAARSQQRSPQQSAQRQERPAQDPPQQHAAAPQSQASRTNQQPQQVRNQPQQGRNQRQVQQSAAFQQHRAGNWASDHRTWQQRGGYNGYRIPDARFNGYFGANHGFRISSLPYSVVGGYPRFRYDGYWLTLVDPWPGTWASDWYDSDDVYVVFGDGGYYLYNRRYPNVGLAIRVSL